ncbi:tannase/feruloyl esterase family alpha/beta hydrolase [Clostridium estertheticum]|uniref:Tannase/feruloyl esterase family alpha/beta hydrolase n=1 Tax=Clostridium estertheticum TaxID=238834 RepID=A0AA47EM28_9CLOT|nr:tannase/feruloyl esterase family alpha/beta hydrolase [Clostridium estertheticum]MBU3157195.1 tannase/feruloyl esterase family alpha/beta hydrolase [Clostridium estertheticum]WAG62702.1 tannase/feruloyl esterase family alpha/beta hydrolase [Clostridium estertheticum]
MEYTNQKYEISDSVRISPIVLPKAVAGFKFTTNTIITSTKIVSGDNVTVNCVEVSLPDYCKVEGKINQRTGEGPTGTAEYYIGFELRLPTEWNECFFFEGGGGSDGVIKVPVGLRHTGTMPALARGFATVATDAGHQGLNCEFGYDQQARLDYAYNAIDQVTVTAKFIINEYYGRHEKYSYFVGGSNGGRQGLVAAQRFGDYFDGIVVGAPALNLTNAAISEMWAIQIFAEIAKKDSNGNPMLNTAFTDADMKLVSTTIIKQFDDADGVVDGLVFDINAARKFDPSTLPKKTANSDGLTDEQIEALKKLFEGPKNGKGKPLYSNWAWDPGISDAAWRDWTLGTDEVLPRNITLGVESMARVFTTPVAANYDPANQLKWVLDYNFDTDPSKTVLAASYQNSLSTNYDTFKKHNGKIILYHGMADPVFSAYDTISYYDKLTDKNGGLKATEEFARLFLVPSMAHVNGGPSTDQFDMLTAITDWVEKGKAPDKIIASGSAKGLLQGITRPLFPYPIQTIYDGKGNKNSAESFVAKNL